MLDNGARIGVFTHNSRDTMGSKPSVCCHTSKQTEHEIQAIWACFVIHKQLEICEKPERSYLQHPPTIQVTSKQIP